MVFSIRSKNDHKLVILLTFSRNLKLHNLSYVLILQLIGRMKRTILAESEEFIFQHFMAAIPGTEPQLLHHMHNSMCSLLQKIGLEFLDRVAIHLIH